ncbi:UDP-glycosyltransferase UGT5-like [Episyrphus balteatus]|uniref:UDP-glycosyltransferase UGT5-like n=1 Tax=Episyrphus balteatus TaxID=286459 RepID=UPI0024855307|nr:UDP-glycosyltransferase UGT5-like [Episyrphus balteatus]XP_055839619.1 UDP-glycosyltransferase UGT5-like [Episyrphus balteatus]
MNWLLLIATICGCTTYTSSYNILGLFPHPGISHFHFFHPIMRGLAEAGHNVTVISHFPNKKPMENYTDLGLPPVDLYVNVVDLKDIEKRVFHTPFHIFFSLNQWGEEACRNTFESDALEQVINGNTQYDLIIMEQFNTDCLMGVAHVLKVPVVALSSCPLLPWHYERVGNPIIPSYIPALFLGQSENIDFLHRIGNWFIYHGFNFLYNHYSHKLATELIRQRFGQHMPETRDLVMNTSVFFVNQHYSLSGAKPLSPAVIELGGIHIESQTDILNKDIQQFLDSAEHGVIVFSWGSMVRAESLSPIKLNALLSAFKRLKQKVIWKWENETLPNQPKNVLISKWLPQKDILRHPNVKVFMTHGGLLGSTEAAYSGIPVVVTPLFADQYHNAATLVERGMGTVLHFKDITETTVYNAITTVLDKKYIDNAKKIAHSFRIRPKSAMETAIWWVEHVIETQGAPLTKSISSRMSRFTYYCLDVYTFLAVLLVVSVFVSRWMLSVASKIINRLDKVKIA